MTATGVPVAYIELVWPILWPLLKPAHEQSDEKPGPDSLLGSIRSGHLQAWLIYDKNIAVGGILTKLIRPATSAHLECLIWLVGGERLSEWCHDFLSKLIPWAKAEGAVCLVAGGRKGWTRLAPRYGFAPIEPRDGIAYWARPI